MRSARYEHLNAMRTESLRGSITAALVGLTAVVACAMFTGCAQPPADPSSDPVDPNAGLLRDFLDGKFDSAGHPLNARVTEAEMLCAGVGTPHDGALRLESACSGLLPGV